MGTALDLLPIGTFAVADEVRHYPSNGLLTEPDNPAGGVRAYGNTDLARVKTFT